eukprot:scaffold203_cov386-Prasinococcus_capsulatus_cf.AAC.24
MDRRGRTASHAAGAAPRADARASGGGVHTFRPTHLGLSARRGAAAAPELSAPCPCSHPLPPGVAHHPPLKLTCHGSERSLAVTAGASFSPLHLYCTLKDPAWTLALACSGLIPSLGPLRSGPGAPLSSSPPLPARR